MEHDPEDPVVIEGMTRAMYTAHIKNLRRRRDRSKDEKIRKYFDMLIVSLKEKRRQGVL